MTSDAVTMPQPGPIVVLNGVPRSGKTSIARAMTGLDPFRRWRTIGVTASRATTPPHLQPGIGLRPGGERPDIEAALPGLVADLGSRIAAESDAGGAVVADLTFHEGHSRPLHLWGILAARLAGRPVWVVGVRCGLDALVDRRRASDGYEDVGPDGRPTPAVLRWSQEAHRLGPDDLEVDTGALAPEAATRAILDHVDRAPSPTALRDRAAAERAWAARRSRTDEFGGGASSAP